jgi:hypothetical protein
MKDVQPRSGEVGTAGFGAGTGQAASSAGSTTWRAAAPWFTGWCRRTGPAAGNFTAGVTVRRQLRAPLMGSGLLIASSALLLAAVTGASPLTIALVAAWASASGRCRWPRSAGWPGDAGQRRRRPGLFVSALQGSLAGGSAAGGVISAPSAGSADLARAGREAPAPSQARLIERVAAPNKHAELPSAAIPKAPTWKELPCPTRL